MFKNYHHNSLKRSESKLRMFQDLKFIDNNIFSLQLLMKKWKLELLNLNHNIELDKLKLELQSDPIKLEESIIKLFILYHNIIMLVLEFLSNTMFQFTKIFQFMLKWNLKKVKKVLNFQKEINMNGELVHPHHLQNPNPKNKHKPQIIMNQECLLIMDAKTDVIFHLITTNLIDNLI